MPYKDSEKKKEYDREYKKKNHEKCRAGSIKYHAGNKSYWKDKDPYEEAEKKGITEKACPGCSHISGREKLPIRAFAKDSGTVGGMQCSCRDCDAYRKSKRRSKGKRKHTLTREYFIELRHKPCKYCNREATLIESNSVDRINSSKGYTKNNVQPCCDVCNKLKLDHADEFFIDHIIRILQNLGFTVSKNGEDSIKDMIRVLEQLGYIVGKKRQQTLFGD